MAEIVTITGKQHVSDTTDAEPDVRVVEALEGMLQEAKAGRIVGLRAALVSPDALSHGITVGAASHAMLGMLYRLSVGLANEMEVEDE